jgi:hypothetical protein
VETGVFLFRIKKWLCIQQTLDAASLRSHTHTHTHTHSHTHVHTRRRLHYQCCLSTAWWQSPSFYSWIVCVCVHIHICQYMQRMFQVSQQTHLAKKVKAQFVDENLHPFSSGHIPCPAVCSTREPSATGEVVTRHMKQRERRMDALMASLAMQNSSALDGSGACGGGKCHISQVLCF